MQDSPGAEHDEGQPQEGQDAPPGSPFVPVEFTGLTVTPYVNQAGRPAFALRLDESDQVDMVPGDGARDRGALPDQISPIPGPAPE